MKPSIQLQPTYFCNNIKNSKKASLVSRHNNNLNACTGTTAIKHTTNHPTANRFINHSHTSIPWRSSNNHYGIDGDSHCLHYFSDTQQYSRCKTDNHATLYGSRSLSTQDIQKIHYYADQLSTQILIR